VAAAPTLLLLSNCTGFSAYSPLAPGPLVPGSAPPGWEPGADASPVANVKMAGQSCQRLALGAFERGPIHVLFDAHNHAAVPPACRAGLPPDSEANVLASLWVDDAEVGAFLNRTYGLPVHVAPVAEAAQEAGPAVLHAWSWGPAQARSDLTVPAAGATQRYQFNDALLWQRGAGIGRLSLAYDREAPATDQVAHGTLRPPMLLGSPPGAFVGTAVWHPVSSAEGTFRLFGDLRCEAGA
jgi:hypothetical protein